MRCPIMLMVLCLSMLSVTFAADEACATAAAEAHVSMHGPSMLLQIAERSSSAQLASERPLDFNLSDSTVVPPAVRILDVPQLQHGLAVVRVPKTGSSTLMLVARRVAELHGLERLGEDILDFKNHTTIVVSNATLPVGPYLYAEHGERRKETDLFRDVMPGTFITAMVRNPLEFCLSHYYHFGAAYSGIDPSDESKIAYVANGTDGCSGEYMADYLDPEKGSNSTADQIIKEYHFVGVVEYYDESLLVLKNMLGLSLTDILYVKMRVSGSDCNWPETSQSKKNGSFEDESDEVRLALTNRSWQRDQELFEAANHSLFYAIAAYGPSFESDLALFRSRLETLQPLCECYGNDDVWKDTIYCIDKVVNESGWD
eukprot:gb/GFBE01078205.1/.p1 GENE.gb/GFBE01078205.1/~~gb/GFBE01078205.1/.p1  ORF type:complete len:372 (+),score=67.05 gb/GFBE01078205.1/:1-1116(+)